MLNLLVVEDWFLSLVRIHKPEIVAFVRDVGDGKDKGVFNGD